MFVLRTEHCLYKLYVTLFLFRGHIPQLYTQFDVDMLFHFMDSDGTIKHDAQNMFIQNNNEVSFHQELQRLSWSQKPHFVVSLAACYGTIFVLRIFVVCYSH